MIDYFGIEIGGAMILQIPWKIVSAFYSIINDDHRIIDFPFNLLMSKDIYITALQYHEIRFIIKFNCELEELITIKGYIIKKYYDQEYHCYLAINFHDIEINSIVEIRNSGNKYCGPYQELWGTTIDVKGYLSNPEFNVWSNENIIKYARGNVKVTYETNVTGKLYYIQRNLLKICSGMGGKMLHYPYAHNVKYDISINYEIDRFNDNLLCSISCNDILYGEKYLQCTKCENNFIYDVLIKWFNAKNIINCPTCNKPWSISFIFRNR